MRTVFVQDLMTQRELEARGVQRERSVATMSAASGGLALTIASIGLFGLMSYGLTTRRGEIGIRMALGAERSRILRGVLWESLARVGLGAALGFLASFATTRYLEGMLFGLPPTDPLTFVVAIATMVAVTTLAAYLPARRASLVDPMTALRHE